MTLKWVTDSGKWTIFRNNTGSNSLTWILKKWLRPVRTRMILDKVDFLAWKQKGKKQDVAERFWRIEEMKRKNLQVKESNPKWTWTEWGALTENLRKNVALPPNTVSNWWIRKKFYWYFIRFLWDGSKTNPTSSASVLLTDSLKANPGDI